MHIYYLLEYYIILYYLFIIIRKKGMLIERIIHECSHCLIMDRNTVIHTYIDTIYLIFPIVFYFLCFFLDENE